MRWVKNPDPKPRALVMRVKTPGVNPYWFGILTTWDEEWEVRAPHPGQRAVVGETRLEALEQIEPILRGARR